MCVNGGIVQILKLILENMPQIKNVLIFVLI